jgi:cytochrome P450
MEIETRADGRKACPYDNHSAEYGANYREIHQQMRAESSVLWTDSYGGHWVVTGYDACRTILLDPETFTIDPVEGTQQFGPMVPQPDGVRAFAETPGMFFFVDGERHDAPRAVLAGPFSKRRMAKKADMMKSHVDRVLDQVLPQGEFDIVHDVGMPVIAGVVSTMLGLELEDPAAIFRAMEGPTQHARDTSSADGSEPPLMTYEEAVVYVREVVQARKKEPREDVISLLLQANNGQFSDEEVEGIAMQVLLASLENPQALTAHVMLYLADRPELRERLRANPDLLPDFLEEGLRYFNPGMTTARTATRDVELGGMHIGRGDRILLHLAAANADPAQFDNPDEFDPERRGVQNLALGAGVHNCLGSHLVQAAVAATVQGLLERIEDYSLTEDDVVRNTDKGSNDMFEIARMRVTALRGSTAPVPAS